MAFQLSNTTTFNVENVLRQNICNSDYYNKTCLVLNSWQDVVDEIYETVEHVEPWMSGNARGPSTAFCLLYRLFTLKLSVREVRGLLDHADSPYIRAVGFLFLRYVADFKTIWQWCSAYAQDPQEFAPSPGGKKVTMGDFVRDILLEQYYFETIFPRIPKTVMDNIIDDLKSRRLPFTAKGNAGAGGPDRRGVDDGNKRPASVKASLSVAMGQRAPNRAGAREDRALTSNNANGTGNKGGSRPPLPRSPVPDERTRSPAPAATYRDGGRDRERDAGRDRERDRDRGRESQGRDAEDRYRREGDRGKRDDYDRGGRRDDYDRGVRRDDYDRGAREDDRRRPRSRSRSRSRDRGTGGGGRDTRDVFRESAKEVVKDSNVEAVRAKYL